MNDLAFILAVLALLATTAALIKCLLAPPVPVAPAEPTSFADYEHQQQDWSDDWCKQPQQEGQPSSKQQALAAAHE